MSAVEDTVARLELLVEQQQEQLAALQQRQVESDDPVLIAQRRQGVEAQLDAPPRSMPEGARAHDFRPRHVRERDKAIAKMQVLAKNRGGVWSPDPRVQSIYGHRGYDPQIPMREACPKFGDGDYATQCHRTCWSPETETRFLYALKLQDFASAPLVPLTPPDPKNNPDLLRELVGLLKSGSSQADAVGRYPTRDETAATPAEGRIRKVQAV